jgi:hypothetical protein
MLFKHKPHASQPKSLIPQLQQELRINLLILVSLLRSLLLVTPSQSQLAIECAQTFFKLARPIQDVANNLAISSKKEGGDASELIITDDMDQIPINDPNQVPIATFGESFVLDGTIYQNVIRQKAVIFELAWKVGTHLLWSAIPRSVKSNDPAREAAGLHLCRFMLRIATFEKEPDRRFKTAFADHAPNQALLLETTLHHINLGLIEPAYERLASFILLSPYNENSVLIGYAGVMCILLAKKHSTSEDLYNRFNSFALVHLADSLAIEPENTSFLSYYIDVHLF